MQNIVVYFKTEFKVEVDEGYSNCLAGWNVTVTVS